MKIQQTLLTTIFTLLSGNLALAHTGAPSGAALLACKAKERSQACQYDGAHETVYIGTCQYMPDRLLCVRNQPIQKKSALNKITPEETQAEKLKPDEKQPVK